MAKSASTRRHTVIGAVGLAVLLVSGMVLATAWLIDVPASVLLGASAVAVAAMTVVLVSAYRASRSSGTGVPRAIARRLNELRKFCRDFF